MLYFDNGKVKIYNDECIKCMTDELDENTFDVVLTSPPYNMTNRKGGISDSGRYDTYIDWKSEHDYIEFTKDVFWQYNKVLKDDGVVLYNFSYSIENPALPYKIVAEICQNTPFNLVDTIVWKKSNAIPFPANKYRLNRVWEYVFVFCKKGHENSFNIYKEVKSVSEETGQTYYEVIDNIIYAKNNNGACELNQATFSTNFVYQLLNIYSKTGDNVLDNFGGTGTTAFECQSMGRKCTMIELSEAQCEYSKKSIESQNSQNIFEYL